MKKKFAAFVLCVICLLSAAGCGQTKTDEQTPPAADQSTTTDDYLTGIGGTYVELFPELSKSEYRNIWIDATAPLVGAENAEATTDLLLGMCMAEPYGPEAAEKYEADPDSMAFNCYFLGGIDKFVMDGHTITGLDAQGQEVFSHTYKLLDEKNENGFIFCSATRFLRNSDRIIEKKWRHSKKHFRARSNASTAPEKAGSRPCKGAGFFGARRSGFAAPPAPSKPKG